MSRIPFALLALSLLLLGSGSAQAQRLPSSTKPVVDAELVQRLGDDFIRADQAEALSIALVQQGQVRYFNFGTVVPGGQQPPTEHSVYEVGSVSKVFTSLLLAHAVVNQRMALDDDIRRHLPGRYPNLHFKGRPVTVRELANTTSALPDNLPDFESIVVGVKPSDRPAALAAALARYSDEDLLRDLHAVTLLGRPGTTPRHSNLASKLLGLMLERVYGAPYPALLQRHVEQPLGMQSGVGEARATLMVTGQDPQHLPMPATNQPAILPAGGLRYSTADLARFVAAELKPATPAMRLSQQALWGKPDALAVGFNWNISRNTESELRLQASGGTFGSASQVEIYPALGYGIVLLANRSGDAQWQLQQLADQVFEAAVSTPAMGALQAALQARGFVDVDKVVSQVRRTHPELHLTEAYVNQWGGSLLAAKQWDAALGLFKFNARRWPKSTNAHDSLGYAYLQLGDKVRAAAAYRRAVRLDPANADAAQSLKALSLRPTQ